LQGALLNTHDRRARVTIST